MWLPILLLPLSVGAQPSPDEHHGMRFGRSVVRLTDLDGDGFRDFAVGAPTAAPDVPGLGLVGAIVVLSGADRELLDVWRGDPRRRGFAHTLRRVGDIDGDRVPDLVVGYQHHAVTEVRSGRTGARLHAFDRSAPEVQALGDLDGDGCGDLLIAAAPHWEVRSGEDGRLLPGGSMFVPDRESRLHLLGDLDEDGIQEALLVAESAEWMTSRGLDQGRGRAGPAYPSHGRRAVADSLGMLWITVSDPYYTRGDALSLPPRAVVRLKKGPDICLVIAESLASDGAPLVLTRPSTRGRPDQEFGYLVVDAGDLDGDGRGDLVTAVGNSAHAHSGADGDLLWSWSGPFELIHEGLAIDTFEDVDGDGAAELLVGNAEQSWTGPVRRDGRVTLLSGRTGQALWEVHERRVEGRFPRAAGEGR